MMFVKYNAGYSISVQTLITFLIKLLAVSTLSGQNLVPNEGFENYIYCPENYTFKPQKKLIPHWTMPTMGTADYFNKCSENVGIPKNYMGFMKPHGGNAYAGIITMFHFNENKLYNTREYLQVKLISKLVRGQKYYIKMHFALSRKSKYSTDKIGIYISNKEIDSSNYTGNLPHIPQIESQTGFFVSSGDNWTALHDYYLANGGEEYLIIGNFRDNKQTRWKENPGGEDLIAYFYIDDVSVYHVFDNSEPDMAFLKKGNNIPFIPEINVVFDPEQDYFTYNWYVFDNITFDFNEFEIRKNGYLEIDKIIKTLIINSSLNILISGHTDSVGTIAYNTKLSELRAKEVADYMIKNGIPETRVKFLGYGKQKPLYNNSKTKNSGESRRVEFMFY